MCVIENWLKNYASLIWVSSIFPAFLLSLTLMIKSWVWPFWSTRYPLWIIGKKNPVKNHVQSTMKVNHTNPGLWLGWYTKPCPDQSVSPFIWNVWINLYLMTYGLSNIPFFLVGYYISKYMKKKSKKKVFEKIQNNDLFILNGETLFWKWP